MAQSNSTLPWHFQVRVILSKLDDYERTPSERVINDS